MYNNKARPEQSKFRTEAMWGPDLGETDAIISH